MTVYGMHVLDPKKTPPHWPYPVQYNPRLPEAEQQRYAALWQSLCRQSDGGVNREQKP